MRLYLDENLSPRVAEMLRARGVDAVSAYEVDRSQLDDRAQFRHAATERRALVTANVDDFVILAHAAIAANLAHEGIILIPRSFDTNEFAAIATGVEEIVKLYPGGLGGAVVFIRRVRD